MDHITFTILWSYKLQELHFLVNCQLSQAAFAEFYSVTEEHGKQNMTKLYN